MQTKTASRHEDATTEMKIALILPAYNEELTIEATVRAFHVALPESAI
jgi:hypothetical protein